MKLLPQTTPDGWLSTSTRWPQAIAVASVAILGALAPAKLQAQTLVSWDFTGESSVTTSTAEVKDSNLATGGLLTRGTGASASAGNNSFRTVGFLNNGIATSNTDYFQTTLAAATGFKVSLATLDAKFAGTASFGASPGVSSQFAYSLDGTNFTLIGSPSVTIGSSATLPQVSLSGVTALQNVAAGTTVTLRYYASGQTTTGGWGFNSASSGTIGFAIGGTVTAAGGPDTTAPTLASRVPTPGATGVSTNASLSMTFSEPVKAGTGNILIKKTSDNATVSTIAIGSATIAGSTVTFAPTGLTTSTGYYVQLASGVVQDIANNNYAGITDTSWSFTTGAGADTTAPLAVTFVPANGATGVSVSSDLSITFNEAVKAGTGNIVIKDTSDNSTIDTIAIGSTTIAGNTVTFTSDNLGEGTSYSVQVASGVILDLANNSFAGVSGTSWSFTTEEGGSGSTTPVLTATQGYTQDFSTYVSAETLPEGWTVAGPILTYGGTWGSSSNSGGFRGGANVLGYLHSSNANSMVRTVTLLNNSGAEITDLNVSYRGRETGPNVGRTPAFLVNVGGNDVSALAYTTSEGDNILKTANVTGLSIPQGESVTISWTSGRGDGSGSSRTIGISEVSVSIGTVTLPPAVGVSAPLSGLAHDSATFNGTVNDEGSSPVTARGFVYSVTETNPAPTIAGTGVTNVPDASGGTEPFSNTVSGLTPSTGYTVRSYATSTVGTSYSTAVTFTTLPAPPTFTGLYEQPFDSYDGNNPAGWTTISSLGVQGYIGEWAVSTNSSGGFLGGASEPGVLGYQHTTTTGLMVTTLKLVNGTGSAITSLPVSYLGRVDRADQDRSPAFVVTVNGTPIDELAYSTAGGVDAAVSHTVTGLSIAPGEMITIVWTSDRGVSESGNGSSKRIGLGEVVIGGDVTPPGNTFSAWALANTGSASSPANGDHDFDGVMNGVEYLFGATGNTFTSMPAVVSGTVSYPIDATAVAAGATYHIQTSPNLTVWTNVDADTSTPGFAKYTLPAPTPGAKLFVRLFVNAVPIP